MNVNQNPFQMKESPAGTILEYLAWYLVTLTIQGFTTFKEEIPWD